MEPEPEAQFCRTNARPWEDGSRWCALGVFLLRERAKEWRCVASCVADVALRCTQVSAAQREDRAGGVAEHVSALRVLAGLRACPRGCAAASPHRCCACTTLCSNSARRHEHPHVPALFALLTWHGVSARARVTCAAPARTMQAIKQLVSGALTTLGHVSHPEDRDQQVAVQAVPETGYVGGRAICASANKSVEEYLSRRETKARACATAARLQAALAATARVRARWRESASLRARFRRTRARRAARRECAARRSRARARDVASACARC